MKKKTWQTPHSKHLLEIQKETIRKTIIHLAHCQCPLKQPETRRIFHFTSTPYRSTLGLQHLIFVFASWFQITSNQNEQNEREDDDLLLVLVDIQSPSQIRDIVTCRKRLVPPSNRIDWKNTVDCQCVVKTFVITIKYSIIYWFHFSRKMYDRGSTFKLARETSPDVRDAANFGVRGSFSPPVLRRFRFMTQSRT